MKKRENPISGMLFILAMVVFFLSFLIGCFLFDGPFGDFAGMFGAWIIGFVTGLFILALSEIIELLDKINKK